MRNMSHILFDHFYRYWITKKLQISIDSVLLYDTSWEWGKFVARHVLNVPEEIIYIKPHRTYLADELLYSSNTVYGRLLHPCNRGDQEYLIYLRKAFQSFQAQAEMSAEIENLSDKIFISRCANSKRSFMNHQEIEDCFESNGYSIVYMEGLSCSDQILAMKNKRVIAGLHGAGLTNIIAASDETKILEIFSNQGSTAYGIIAKQLGNSYSALDRRPAKHSLFLPISKLQAVIDCLA